MKTKYRSQKLVGAVFLFYLLFTVYADAKVIDKIAARVNGDIILMSEVKGKRFMVLYDMRSRDKDLKNDDIYRVEKEVLNEMIEEKLMLQFAEDNNIKVSDEEIKLAIEDIKKQNNFTDEMLEKDLNKDNITLNDYKERLRAQITVSKVINYEVRSKVHVEETEVRNSYEDPQDELKTPQ